MNKLSLLASSLALVTAAACGEVSSPDMPEPELGLSSLQSSARVIRNRTVDVTIEITRNESLVGPVAIEVDGLPAGVTAQPLEIAEGETSGLLKLVAADGIALGEKPTVVVRAIAGDTVAESKLRLRLTDRPGSIDKTFATSGFASAHYSTMHTEELSHVAMQSDGKIVAAGRNSDFKVTMVTRFNADGSVDKDFGDGGSYPGPVVEENIVGVMVRPDGTIVVVAEEGPQTNVRVLSATGSPLNTLVLSTATTGGELSARSMVPMPDGSLYILGVRGDDAAVVYLNSALALDASFDGDGVAIVDFGMPAAPTTLLRRPDGRLVITGYVHTMSSALYAAAQLQVDGSPDDSFSGDGVARYDLLPEAGLFLANLLPDGRTAAVSYEMSQGDVALVHIEADGTIDMSKALPMDMYPRSAVAVTGGVLVVGANWDGNEMYATKYGTAGLDLSFGFDGVMQAHAPTGGEHRLMHAVQVDEDRAIGVGAIGASSTITKQAVTRIWL